MVVFSGRVSSQATAFIPSRPRQPIAPRLQVMHAVFMEKSFKAQIADYRYFHRHWMGDIIVLVGTSTAGKTSIIKALKQMEPDRVEDGGDLRQDVAAVKHFRNNFPEEVAMLEKVMDSLDIIKAVFSPSRSWKLGVSHQEKMESEVAIQRIQALVDSESTEEIEALSVFHNLDQQMFDDAFERSRQGGSTIFDVLYVEEVTSHAQMRNFDGPMRVVSVYCPFYLLSSRMERRNKEARESGNLMNQRVGEFPLKQFSQVYTRRNEGQRALEVITLAQATHAFNENFDQRIIDHRQRGRELRSDKEIHAEKVKFRRCFLRDLGFTANVDRVEIAPRNPHLYHLLLNSGNLTPEASAKILLMLKGI